MKRLFEFRDGSSAKFWEITLEGSTVITRYGKIGSVGNNAHKSFDDAPSAQKEFEKLIKEKTKKGYLELGAAPQPEPVKNQPVTNQPVTSQMVQTSSSNSGDTTYLENKDTNEFFEVHEHSNHLRVQRGIIGQPCLEYHAKYKTKGRENYERLIKEWKKKGFKVVRPKTPIVEGSVADELIASEIEDHPVYSRIFGMGWGEELRGQQKRIFVFKNGLNWIGNLDFEDIADMDLTTGMVIEGDVNVSGVLSQLTYTYPNPILITGNVRAQSFGHRDSHLCIDGDLRVENIVYGEYNDGQLDIGGDVHGQAWISADHSMHANGTYFLPRFHDGYDGLSPKVLDFEGGLDWDALREFIWENKNPLRKDFALIEPESKKPSAPESLIEPEPEEYPTPDSLIEQKIVTGEQIESFQESDRSIQILIEAMTEKTGGKRTMKLLESPPSEALVRCHSDLLLFNALLKNRVFPGAYLGLLERLIEVGCDPRFLSQGRAYINESLLTDQADVMQLMQRMLKNKPVWSLQNDRSTGSQESELRQRVIVLAGQEDIEGMTRLLERYPNRNDEWLAFVAARLEAPSSTPEQRERLRALLPVWQPTGDQIGEKHLAHPDIQTLIDVILTDSVKQVLEFLEQPIDRELMQIHSWVVLDSARWIVEQTGGLEVIEKLLELGCDPRSPYHSRNIIELITENGHESAQDVLELFYNFFPDVRPVPTVEDARHTVKVLQKLIELENKKADFESPENRAWLESIYVLEVVVAKVKRIPASIGRLINLKTLALVFIEPEGLELPESIGDLVNLESLILGMSGFTSIPDLSRLTKLQKLSLRSNSIKTLPALPSGLNELMIDSNPWSEHLNFSTLTELKFLSLNSVRFIPKGLEQLSKLEGLVWNDAQLTTFPEAITAFSKLTHLQLSGSPFLHVPHLGNLQNLTELSLYNCNLKKIPEGLLELATLETVDVSGNADLPSNVAQALRDRGVRVTINDADANTSTDEAPVVQAKMDTATKKLLKQIKSLNKSAHAIMQTQTAQALEQFSQALRMTEELLSVHRDQFSFDALFALQGKLWCVNELVGTQPERTQDAIALANQVLEFAQTHSEMYYSEMGALVRGSQTLAHNTLAWYALETGVGLKAALKNANAAITELDYQSDAATFSVVLETKVKILFALERHEEAFACIYRMNRAFPDLEYFKTQAQTQAFKQWDAEN